MGVGPLIIPSLQMRKWRHREISWLAKLGQVAELRFAPGSVAAATELLTAQLCCLSSYF